MVLLGYVDMDAGRDAGFEKRFQAILKDCEARADDKQLPQQLRPKGATGSLQKVRIGSS